MGEMLFMTYASYVLDICIYVALFGIVIYGAMKCHLVMHAAKVTKLDWIATALVLMVLTQVMNNAQVILLPAAVLFGLATNAICARLGGMQYRLFLPVILFSLSPYIWFRDIGRWPAMLVYILSGLLFCLADCIFDTFTKKKIAFCALLLLISCGMILAGKVVGTIPVTEHIFDILMILVSAILSIAMGVLFKYYFKLRKIFTVVLTAITLAAMVLVQIVSYFAIAL